MLHSETTNHDEQADAEEKDQPQNDEAEQRQGPEYGVRGSQSAFWAHEGLNHATKYMEFVLLQ